jgi:hypothetical protein
MYSFGFLILILIGLAVQVGIIALAVQLGTGKVRDELIEVRKALAANRTL